MKMSVKTSVPRRIFTALLAVASIMLSTAAACALSAKEANAGLLGRAFILGPIAGAGSSSSSPEKIYPHPAYNPNAGNGVQIPR